MEWKEGIEEQRRRNMLIRHALRLVEKDLQCLLCLHILSD